MLDVFEKLTGYFRASGSKETTNDDATAPKTQPDGSERVDDGTSRKRPITVEYQEPPDLPARKKVHRRSEHERRLMGDFSQPKTAMPLPLPRGPDPDESETHPKLQPKKQKPGARQGIRPTNTLGSSPHAAASQQARTHGFMEPRSNMRPMQSSIVTGQPVHAHAKFDRKIRVVPDGLSNQQNQQRTMEAVVVPTNATSYGDGFSAEERKTKPPLYRWQPDHPNKKTKIDFAGGSVDLTNDKDDTAPVEIMSVNGRAVPGRLHHSEKTQAPLKAPALFGTKEFESLTNMTSSQALKRKRKSREGPGSSQASSHGTPVDAANGLVYGDDSEVTRSLAQKLIDDENRNLSTSARPPIKLDQGMDVGWRSSKQLSTQLPQARNGDVDEVSQALTKPRGRAGQLQGQNGGHGHRSTPQKSADRVMAQFAEPNSSRNLRDTFERDDQQSFPRQKATARMKATSHNGNSREISKHNGSDSQDELAGETTVGSQASRSNSPQKRSKAQTSGQSAIRNRKPASSPSDLPPTQFKKGECRKRNDLAEANAKAETATTDYDATDRAPVKAFYATSCILTSGKIELEYDNNDNQIYLHLDGLPKALPNGFRVITISVAEAHSVWHSPDNCRVVLRGSASAISYGHICIAFENIRAVKWFLSRLWPVAEECLVYKNIDSASLDQRFLTQIKIIQGRYNKSAVQASEDEVASLAYMKRQLPNGGQESGEEAIIYEGDDRPRKTYGQTAAARLSKAAQGYERSHHFEPRRSSRQSIQIKQHSPSPEPIRKWTQENKPKQWNHSVVYPTEGMRRVTVDFQDLERLDEGEMLNDNVVSFAMRRIEETMSPDHKDEVFFFNSFFYTALTSKNRRRGFNYEAVKRWTKNKDLLTLPYIVVPICIDSHWFVAILCNMSSVSRKAVGIADDEDVDQIKEHDAEKANPLATTDHAANDEADGTSIKFTGDSDSHPDGGPSLPRPTDGVEGVELQEQTAAMSQLSLSRQAQDTNAKPEDADEAAAEHPDVEVIQHTKSTPKRYGKVKKKAPPPPKTYDPDKPTIILLDSLGMQHATETRNLKEYLKAEAAAKRGIELDTKELQGMTAKGIPEQTNMCDCGLYVVGYIEQFAKNPRDFVTKVLTRQLDKQADFASFNPSAKRDEIRDQLLKLHEEQEAAHKVKKSAKKTNGKAITDAIASSPTPAPLITKTPKPTVPQLPAANSPVEAAVSAIPEQPFGSATPQATSKAHVDAAGDDILEQAVPRALPVIGPNSAAARDEVKTSNMSMNQNSGADRHCEEFSLLEDPQLPHERMPSNDEEDEEMIETADVPMEGPSFHEPSAHRTDLAGSADPNSKSDPLDALEDTLKANQAKLDAASFANGTPQMIAPAPAGGMLRPTRGPKRSPKPAEVIDLESDDASLEIPESPRQQHESIKYERRGRHIKFSD